MVEPHRAHHLSPPPFGELQVVGVIDHAADIGVLEIDPQEEYVNAIGAQTRLSHHQQPPPRR